MIEQRRGYNWIGHPTISLAVKSQRLFSVVPYTGSLFNTHSAFGFSFKMADIHALGSSLLSPVQRKLKGNSYKILFLATNSSNSHINRKVQFDENTKIHSIGGYGLQSIISTKRLSSID